MLVTLISIFFLTGALAVLSALFSAVSTIRGGVAASADVQSESREEQESSRRRMERLMIAIRLAWGCLFSLLVVVLLHSVTLLLPAGEMSTAASFRYDIGTAASMVASVVAALIFGELLPAFIGARNPERTASLLTRPVSVALRVFGPLPRVIQRVLYRLGRLSSRGEAHPVASEEDIRHLVHEVHEAGAIEEGERQIINRVFNLGERPLVSLMTPRADVVSLDLSQPLDVLLEQAVASRLSCFPVLEGSGDYVSGTISLHSLIGFVQNPARHEKGLHGIVEPPLQAPESMTALQLLELFRERGMHFAIVVDEYGVFAGVVTLTDVLEVLVGDLNERGDRTGELVTRSDGSLLADSSIDIHELFANLGVDDKEGREESHFHSLGGFVMNTLGHVPSEGEVFDYAGYRFEVVDMDGKRIDKVLITLVPAKRAVGS